MRKSISTYFWMILFFFLGNVLFGFSQQIKISSLQNVSIFPPQEKHTHGSSIVALPNGDLLAVWFEGSGERKSDDVLLMGARLKASNSLWSKPFIMADTKGIPDCNPVLFFNQKGDLFLVWIAVLANEWEHSILRLKRSKSYLGEGAPIWNWQDNIFLKPGTEFAEEVSKKWKDLPDSNLGWSTYAPRYEEMIIESSQDSKKRSIGWMTRIKPLVLPNRIILPLYSDGFNFSMMAISDDQGETWSPSLPLVGKGPIQPALVQKKDGQVVAMLRDAGDAPSRIQSSISNDLGMSWSAAQKTNFPNTASVELLVLQDGRWWMIGNDIEDGRYQLALWISEDEGANWSNPQYLEHDSNRKSSFSYPAIVQAKDGLVHLTYSKHTPEGKTIQYRLLDPKQIH